MNPRRKGTPIVAKKNKGTRAASKPTPQPERKSRRVFPVGQCHHRDSKGQPDCTEQIVAKRANLCPPHESIWQKAARARYAANRAAVAQTTTTTKRSRKQPTAADDAATVEAVADPEGAVTELEEQLAASVSAFATPELAEKARAKRQARRQGR